MINKKEDFHCQQGRVFAVAEGYTFDYYFNGHKCVCPYAFENPTIADVAMVKTVANYQAMQLSLGAELVDWGIQPDEG